MSENLGLFEGLSKVLDDLLRSNPKTAAELADETGLSSASLSRYRNGRAIPDAGALGRLLEAMGVSLSQFEGLLARASNRALPTSALPDGQVVGYLVLVDQRGNPTSGTAFSHRTLSHLPDTAGAHPEAEVKKAGS